jgi:hypothetical protein
MIIEERCKYHSMALSRRVERQHQSSSLDSWTYDDLARVIFSISN